MMRRFAAMFLGVALASVGRAAPPEVTLTYAPIEGRATFTGRVFVIASEKPIGSGVFSQSWFSPSPFYAQDVRDWKPGEPLVFRPSLHFPKPWAELADKEHHFQAILDCDLGGRDALTSPGNRFSKAERVAPGTQSVKLHADQVVPEKRFEEKPRRKLVDIESKLLSAFHGRPMRLRAAVLLPKSHDEAKGTKFPVVYEIPGFGGTHTYISAPEGRNGTDVAGVEMLYVMLDPSCRLGHHVFADSANNGPVGRALVEELIPALEAKFGGSGQRFVTGHSSGGWSSLWLQVTYPDLFDGVWSTAPDPVDFRDFQLVDLTRPKQNLFVDAEGAVRPLARKDGKVAFTYRRFSDMERVFGRGGQLGSFEAVFSPRGADGKPRELWDRDTGAVDPDTAKAWEKYDIRLTLARNAESLRPKLKGKIHVYMGDEDTYYLDGATRLLRDALAPWGRDAVVEMFPGRHHGNLIDAALRKRINAEMAARAKR